MHDEELAVFGVAIIEFDEIRAGAEGHFERGQGVFGGELAVAAVANDERAWAGEKAECGEVGVSERPHGAD